MADVFHRSLFLAGPVGPLEALLWAASGGNSDLAAVVCHPHPLFAGTMHNKVVYQTAKALQRSGVPVLRFNFRGVGMSEGTHDRGRGELDDVRSSIDYMATEFPGRRILVAGFSFGSWVGLRVGCEDARVVAVIGLGLPVDKIDMSYLSSCGKPKLMIQGGNDQFGARANVQELFETLPEPKRLVIVDGADHFFTGRLDTVAAAIDEWLQWRASVAVTSP